MKHAAHPTRLIRYLPVLLLPAVLALALKMGFPGAGGSDEEKKPIPASGGQPPDPAAERKRIPPKVAAVFRKPPAGTPEDLAPITLEEATRLAENSPEIPAAIVRRMCFSGLARDAFAILEASRFTQAGARRAFFEYAPLGEKELFNMMTGVGGTPDDLLAYMRRIPLEDLRSFMESPATRDLLDRFRGRNEESVRHLPGYHLEEMAISRTGGEREPYVQALAAWFREGAVATPSLVRVFNSGSGGEILAEWDVYSRLLPGFEGDARWYFLESKMTEIGQADGAAAIGRVRGIPGRRGADAMKAVMTGWCYRDPAAAALWYERNKTSLAPEQAAGVEQAMRLMEDHKGRKIEIRAEF